MLCATRPRVTVSCVYVCIVGPDRIVPLRFVCALIIGMRTDRQEPVVGGSVSAFEDRRDPTRRVAASK